jgi:hypothetical protein
MILRILPLAAAVLFAIQAQPSTALKPPKPDLPYLKHADNLIPTEAVQAQEEKKKDESTFVIAGAESSAKTPLALPVFIFQSDKIPVESLQLYRLDSKNGHREITIGKKGAEPIRLQVKPLEGKLYRIEVYDEIEPGEYSLSPNNSNTAFCFEVIN